MPDERTTGATTAQIGAAAFKFYKNPSLTDDEYGEYAEWAMGESARFASALVPPDARIVENWSAVRAAMERAINVYWRYCGGSQQDADIALLRKVLTDAE